MTVAAMALVRVLWRAADRKSRAAPEREPLVGTHGDIHAATVAVLAYRAVAADGCAGFDAVWAGARGS